MSKQQSIEERVESYRPKEKRLCIGFGELEGKCPNRAGSKWSRYWCPRCDQMRVNHISGQLGKIVSEWPGAKT